MIRLPQAKERPILSNMFVGDVPSLKEFDVNNLIYWVKKTPECIGIIKRIATDIVTEIYFTSVASQETGRPSKKIHIASEERAMAFARKNLLRRKIIAAVMDALITGDFYIWKGKVTDNQIKEIALKNYLSYGIEMKEIEVKQFFDEDWNGLNTVEVVPSSTMKIKTDEFKVTSFVQEPKTSPKTRKFTPDEIIHYKLLDLDGNVYGYTPMQASYSAIRIINSIQDYSYAYFENGAKLDRVWKFMGNVNPEYIKMFKETLKQYISVKKARGYLVLTGADKIETETLNEINEEMEYRQLAIHSVGRLAFAFNMPADILSSILGVDIKGTAVGSDIEDAGYNRNIIQMQKDIEELLNSQLFCPEFKVEISFERTFRQDQIRQIQYRAMAMPFLEFIFKHKIPVVDAFIYDTLQIDKKYVESNKGIERETEPTPFKIPKQEAPPNQAKVSENKKLEQRPQQEINKPLGV